MLHTARAAFPARFGTRRRLSKSFTPEALVRKAREMLDHAS